MKAYIFAISVVAQNKNVLNNKMSNGYGTFPQIRQWIKNFKYMQEFNSSIKLINFNIQEVDNVSNSHEINKSYQNGVLKECLAGIIDELSKLDISQEN